MVSRFFARRLDALAILALIILWILFFWRLYTPTPADRVFITQSDFSSQYYNFSMYQARRFDAGSLLPAWNPYNYGGSPFLADPQGRIERLSIKMEPKVAEVTFARRPG